MANFVKKVGTHAVDAAHEIATKATTGAKNIADSANKPTALTPTPPHYADHADTTLQTHPETHENLFTHDYPFLRLTEEDEPIRPSKDRLNPYVMRGRHHEFQHLANILEDPLPGPIHLITGPPGYGKSTMLEMVKRYAQRIGFITVEIPPKLFADTNTLIEHIRSEVLGPHMAPFHTQTATDAHTGGSASANVNAKVAQAGIDVQHIRGHSQTHERKGSPLLLHHLRQIIALLAQHPPHTRGLLFLGDEFQTISNTIQNDNQAYETARENLYTLNEGFHRGEDKLPITTFLAGLTTAPTKLGELLTRPPNRNVTELLPIDGYPVQDPDSTHCAQIIQDFILAGQKAHKHQLQIHPRDLYRWGRDCKGHPVYATQAGTLIQEQLQLWHEHGKTTIEPTDVRDLDDTIRQDRETYYARRIAQINENKPNDIGLQLTSEEQKLAHLMLQHIMVLIATQQSEHYNQDNPHFNTWQAMLHVAEQLHSDTTVVHRCIDKLVTIGAIRNMQFPTLFVQYDPTNKKLRRNNPSPLIPSTNDSAPSPIHDSSVTPITQHKAYLDSAIPSLTNYVLSEFPDREAAVRKLHSTNQEALATFDLYLATRWPWTNEPNLPKIPAYSAFTYNPPRTPSILTPAQADTRQKEINAVINEQHSHWEQTEESLPWPNEMPQILDDDPNHKTPQNTRDQGIRFGV